MPKFTLDSFRKDLAPKYKLAPQLEKAIGTFDQPWKFVYEPKQHDLFWHPSGDCTPDASHLYDSALDRLNPDPADEAKKRKQFGKYGPVGHFWHQFLQTIMVRYEMVEDDAIEREGFKSIYTPDTWGTDPGDFRAVRGSADVVPWFYKDRPYVVDFKTMGSRNFQAVNLPASFAAKYECQMNIYMDFFNCDRALILAINKDTPHDFKEFEFRRNQDLIDAIYAKWQYVVECLKDGERPDEDDDQSFSLSEWV